MKKIVFINQWVNFQMKDIINDFAEKIDNISLLYGTITETGNELNKKVKCYKIITYNRRNQFSRLITWIIATIQIYVIVLIKYRKYHLFITTNPPTNAFITLGLGNKYSVNVLDIYPEALSYAGFISEKSLLYKLWEKQNYRFFERAVHVFTLTDGMAKTISKYRSLERIQVIPYWSSSNKFNADEIQPNKFKERYKLDKNFIIMYSGNIGLGHHVSTLVEVANLLKGHEDITFVIIGEGWNKPVIENLIQEYNLSNCVLLPFQSPEMFAYSIKAADIGVVSVSKELAPVCVPSKTYNLISNQIPILFITEGESELDALANKYKIGQCFGPSEVKEIGEFILSLKNQSILYEKYKVNLQNCSINFTAKNASLYVDSILE